MNELPMPFLDITSAQPSFRCHLGILAARNLINSKVLLKINDWDVKQLTSPWKSRKLYLNVGQLDMHGVNLIKAVATLEDKCLVRCKDGQNGYHELRMDINSSSPVSSSSEDLTEEADEREMLRRSRISKANKGNTPWNKGRKHSAETLQRIKERTRLAMQDPKVKMKLINMGHSQSEQTRIKIGVGVRMGWQRRREKLELQETCHFEWLNLIAEASRRGYVGEEELQWDSYQILDKELEQEWLESVEQRKNAPRPKGSKRAPKSPEQRRKISEAISAKWADPGYRDRVCSALAKYHGIPDGVERKPRRRRVDSDAESPRRPARKRLVDRPGSETKSQKPRLKRGIPLYKDPLVSTKLEMIKNIRAQRAAAETNKNEAMERAKLLIAEAEKAANALEEAATRSPLARASLMETRKLIAEANRSIEAIDTGGVNHVDEEVDAESQVDAKKVNGTRALPTSEYGDDLDLSQLSIEKLLNRPRPSSGEYGVAPIEMDKLTKKPVSRKKLGQIKPNGSAKFCSSTEEVLVSKSKRWVRGRLVEVIGGGDMG